MINTQSNTSVGCVIFFAVCNVHGPISVELDATDLESAKSELKTAIEDGTARMWIDDARSDIEDEFGIQGADMSENEFEQAMLNAELTLAYGTAVRGEWSIWMFTEE